MCLPQRISSTTLMELEPVSAQTDVSQITICLANHCTWFMMKIADKREASTYCFDGALYISCQCCSFPHFLHDIHRYNLIIKIPVVIKTLLQQLYNSLSSPHRLKNSNGPVLSNKASAFKLLQALLMSHTRKTSYPNFAWHKILKLLLKACTQMILTSDEIWHLNSNEWQCTLWAPWLSQGDRVTQSQTNDNKYQIT